VLDGAISVRNVTFRYSAHAEPALLDVSLEIPAGKITVISGPSGCGKSTLLRVLLGYLMPKQGEVCYDGVTLGGWHLDVLRGQIGAVLQEDALWDGILRNNISGMAPFSLDEVWESLRLVDLDKDVDKMPRKVNTFAGEATLSTGQIQRLVMARQLIRKPRLLILDEATSALDEATEARVFANLRTLNVTCICVAHRESTLAHADRIYRMRDGKIVI
jgi:ABC-type bacteriocin/lantibiotic exporter with double-glycine peptidase domain